MSSMPTECENEGRQALVEGNGVGILMVEDGKMSQQVFLGDNALETAGPCDQGVADPHATEDLHDRRERHLVGKLERALQVSGGGS